MTKPLIKDRIFFKIVHAVFYIIYGYFDPPGVVTSFQVIVHHAAVDNKENPIIRENRIVHK